MAVMGLGPFVRTAEDPTLLLRAGVVFVTEYSEPPMISAVLDKILKFSLKTEACLISSLRAFFFF
jgi:hypothetical protein